jgi:hypothetical protein
MRHSEYTQFFRQLASQHVNMRHSEEECRFLRLTFGSGPLQRIMDAREFYDSLRSKLSEGYAIILISYDAEYPNNNVNQKLKEFHFSSKKPFTNCKRPFFCRSGGIRTHDLQHPMLARYQATLHPENFLQHNKNTALLQ